MTILAAFSEWKCERCRLEKNKLKDKNKQRKDQIKTKTQIGRTTKVTKRKKNNKKYIRKIYELKTINPNQKNSATHPKSTY